MDTAWALGNADVIIPVSEAGGKGREAGSLLHGRGDAQIRLSSMARRQRVSPKVSEKLLPLPPALRPVTGLKRPTPW